MNIGSYDRFIDSIYSPKQAAALVGVDRSTIDRWVKAGIFPQKLKLGPGRCGFAAEDIANWLRERRSNASS